MTDIRDTPEAGKPHEYLPFDRCPRCGERVSRTCPDCYAMHLGAIDAMKGCIDSKPHPFPRNRP